MQRGFVSYGTLTQKELPLHRNMGMEIVLVDQGHLRWQVDGREARLRPGQVFFTLPWQAHGSAALHEPGNRIHFLQLRLDRTYTKPAAAFEFHEALAIPEDAAQRLSRVFCRVTRHAWPATAELAWLVRTVIGRLEAGSGRVLFIQGLVRSLLDELSAIVAEQANASRFVNPTERRVERFLDALQARCDETWTLADMAAACRLGRTRFAGIVRTLTGDSPVTHLNRLRTERAEHLLAETDRPVTDVAFECGFSTAQLFSRTFRQFTHRTPRDYRKECRRAARQPVLVWTEREEAQRFRAVREREWV